MYKKLLCLLGIHTWVFVRELLFGYLYECERCGKQIATRYLLDDNIG